MFMFTQWICARDYKNLLSTKIWLFTGYVFFSAHVALWFHSTEQRDNYSLFSHHLLMTAEWITKQTLPLNRLKNENFWEFPWKDCNQGCVWMHGLQKIQKNWLPLYWVQWNWFPWWCSTALFFLLWRISSICIWIPWSLCVHFPNLSSMAF